MFESSCDFETRSACDLKKAGAYRYSEDPTTDVLCFAFMAPGHEEPLVWRPDSNQAPIGELLALVNDPAVTFRAWNAPFERAIWRGVMVRKYGFPDIPLERWVCTASEARAMGLPGKLDDAARVLAGEQKDMAGHRLMLRMSKPRATLRDDAGRVVGYTWWDDEDKVQRLIDYCRQDVRTELGIAARIQRLQPEEREMWLLDQRINDRGVLIDRPLVEAAVFLSEKVASTANRELERVTDRAVEAVTRVPALKKWLAEVTGRDIETLSKKAVADLIEDDSLPEPARAALALRLENGKSSVKKLQAFLNAACADDALRGLLLYWGANTGRWAGRLVQPQNFPARTAGLPEWAAENLQKKPEPYIEAVMAGDVDRLDMDGPPLELVALLLRSMLVARPGHMLYAADYSAIEARVTAWLCGEEWRLEVFRTHGKIYEASAGAMFGIPMELFAAYRKEHGTHHPARQKGKVAELALGYGGGVNALVAMGAYEMGLDDAELPDIVSRWRIASPNIKAGWYDLQEAAIAAVKSPGLVTEALKGRVRFKLSGGFLWLRLPSGRRLAYCKPHVVQRPAPWNPDRMIDALHAWSVDNKTKKWGKRSLWGGLLMENVVQAVSRDIMAHAMRQLDLTGRYHVLLTVHDEIVTEARPEEASVEELVEIMCNLPEWADGCPIAADGSGYPSRRYKK